MAPPGADVISFGLSLRFLVVMDNFDLGMWTSVDGLDVKWDVAEYKAGDGDNMVWFSPGAPKYTDVTLVGGVNSTEQIKNIYKWIEEVSFDNKPTSGEITMQDATRKEVFGWTLEGCLPVAYTGPKLDANGSKVATHTLKVKHIGFMNPNDGKLNYDKWK